MKYAKTITFANHKGGVGKTTTTASMGSILASKGYHVLLVDLDAQANLTSSLLKSEIGTSVYDAMIGQNTSLPVYNIGENLDIVPSSLQLAQADLDLAGTMARERILSELLEEKTSRYDYILIDCPPSLSLMTLNALTASDYVIIPMIAEALPVNGLTMMYNFVQTVKRKLNPRIEILGILITRFESTNLSKHIENGLRKNLGDTVFTGKIRKNVTVAQAPLETVNIVEYDPKSNGAKDYKAFTEEFLARMGK